MKIAVVCDVLGVANNGTTIAALNLINSLKAKGHEVRVLCPDEDKKDIDGYYVMPKVNFLFLNNYVAKNGVALSRPVRKKICEALDGVDAVHVMTPFFLGIAARKYAVSHGVPLTAGFHCQAENFTSHIFLMNNGRFNRAVYRFFWNNLYKYCDCIHYPTQFICDTFEEIVGETPHRIISNGVHDEFVPCDEEELHGTDTFRILFIGRFSKEKSHPVLVKAAALSKHRDKIQLVFAGDGPQKTHVKNECKKLGLRDPEIGFFSRKDLLDIIYSADLYVHPAEIEIEAIACLEAISCGKVPVISDSPRCATKHFALGEQNLFKYNDPTDLAEKIDYWIENPEKRKECRKEYLGFAEDYRFSACMDKMEKMIVGTAEEKCKKK